MLRFLVYKAKLAMISVSVTSVWRGAVGHGNSMFLWQDAVPVGTTQYDADIKCIHMGMDTPAPTRGGKRKTSGSSVSSSIEPTVVVGLNDGTCYVKQFSNESHDKGLLLETTEGERINAVAMGGRYNYVHQRDHLLTFAPGSAALESSVKTGLATHILPIAMKGKDGQTVDAAIVFGAKVTAIDTSSGTRPLPLAMLTPTGPVAWCPGPEGSALVAVVAKGSVAIYTVSADSTAKDPITATLVATVPHGLGAGAQTGATHLQVGMLRQKARVSVGNTHTVKIIDVNTDGKKSRAVTNATFSTEKDILHCHATSKAAQVTIGPALNPTVARLVLPKPSARSSTKITPITEDEVDYTQPTATSAPGPAQRVAPAAAPSGLTRAAAPARLSEISDRVSHVGQGLDVLLAQALKNHDMANIGLVIKDTRASHVRSTVGGLTVDQAVALLNVCVTKMRTSPHQAAALVPWVRWTLIEHASGLSGRGGLESITGPLYSLIEQRTRHMEGLGRLGGRLDLVLSRLGGGTGEEEALVTISDDSDSEDEYESDEEEEEEEEEEEAVGDEEEDLEQYVDESGDEDM